MLESKTPRVLVQGITGRQARFWTEQMQDYGTDVVAGVTPGKGGESVLDVPVFDSVREAVARVAVDVSVLFVPPRAAAAAAQEAIEAAIGTVVVLTEHIPVHDTMRLLAEAKERGSRIVGPNSPGLAVPGSYFVGILPLWETSVFGPGPVGVVSRSGSLGTLVCLELLREGWGQSGLIGIGGDPIVGTTFADALEHFERDPNTHAVALLGEIGGTMEEDASTCVKEMSTPVVAFIAGASAPRGTRMGHAGAIVSGSDGSAGSKVQALEGAGARVAKLPSGVASLVSELLR